MEFEDLKNKNPEELKEMLAQALADVRMARAKAKLGQLKQVHTIAAVRKTIAQIKTILAK